MDLQMPEMNGLDAIVAIRNDFPGARIIVLTTYVGDVQIASPQSRRSGLPAEKPFA
jgi:CheY-like chemotaxis protein